MTTQTGPAVDFDDPATWPEDMAAMESLLDQGAEAEPGEDLEGDSATLAGDKAAQEPSGILTRDGKHILPYDELVTARQRATEAERALEAMHRELDGLRSQTVETTAQAPVPQMAEAPPVRSADAVPDLLAQYQQLRQAAEQDGDPELAKAYGGTVALLERQQALEQRMLGFVQQAEQREQDVQRAEVTAAVERNPVLSEWAQDPTWLARAQEVEGRIMAIPGSAYAQAKDWDGRFQAVVDAVHAVYGPSPAARRVRPIAAAAQGRAAPAALPQDAELNVPPSISALGAGQAMTDRDDQMAAFERMTPSEMMRHLGTLADKGLLGQALAGLSV